MIFEYNAEKSIINKQKHGIDFEEAKVLWISDNVILTAISKGEQRFMIIGKINFILYSCIYTIRGRKTRIISCRRSREKEKGIYHEKIKKYDNN